LFTFLQQTNSEENFVDKQKVFETFFFIIRVENFWVEKKDVREQSPTLQVFEFEAFEFADEVLENVEV
jgi:hypothetical protein